MNKQQLALKIWESANKMRSKIEANEYKDYILGFIFYKFLSDQEVEYLKANDWTDEDLPELTEADPEIVESVQRNLGYFISYENLFSTWIENGNAFSAENVTDALSAFSRLIHPTHKALFDNIFATLQSGLSKLGETSGARTKAIRDLIYLIRDIPMDGKQDYDVLGFIYEYLISNFAANAGKKAGEFYTPHEVSLLMSEIVAHHLQDRDEIEIYDPTSGSGSLLINIGKCAARYMGREDGIKYYAQELKENTYNLTRMNLVMRGILPHNIRTRNGDTLEEDWPYFDDKDPVNTYNRLYVDAVVSNPPYSQAWNPADKDLDPRYAPFGLAPKSKADYAFLLHDLYHLKPDGIMAIVLPHGVLFRGGEEGAIRKNLIEQNHIEAIIGLPANIFFGTSIPTLIMVLKQNRDNTDVLMVDASKGFAKVGKNNALRACDIKRIVDVVTCRSSVDKFSRVVSRDEIRANDYNLNIPRYVDSSEKAESWDIYASMFGGIPNSELEELHAYWEAFPGLKEALFSTDNGAYYQLKVKDLQSAVRSHPSVAAFLDSYGAAFADFEKYMRSRLLDNMQTLNIAQEESALSDAIFARLAEIPLVDPYEAYQLLDDEWGQIATDLEIIQTEGFSATKQVEPNMVLKKKNGREQEVQEGWEGRIVPFDLAQRTLLMNEFAGLTSHKERLEEISSEYESLIAGLSEDDKQKLLNDDNTSFVANSVKNALTELLEDISTDEIAALREYLSISRMADKERFVEAHPEVGWSNMTANKNGAYTKKEIEGRIGQLATDVDLTEGTYAYAVTTAAKLLQEEKDLKAVIKKEALLIDGKTKETIQGLSDSVALELLEAKWISPTAASLGSLAETVLDSLVDRIRAKNKKYETTFADTETEIEDTQTTLLSLLDGLTGSEYDMAGIGEFKKLLGGE